MRKIDEVRTGNEVGLNVVARPRDTYVRPAAPQKDRLVSIAETLVKINPQLNKYLEKKEEEKRHLEELVGIDLYNRYKTSSAEIQGMIKNGEIEGFRKLTQNHLRGIHKMRHRALADGITSHMLVWERQATVDDGNGNLIPISKLSDERAAIDAFEAEKNRYTQEVTQGQYDRTLFGEIVEQRTEHARSAFIERFSQAKASQMLSERQEAFGAGLNSLLAHYTTDNKLILDSAELNEDGTPRESYTTMFATQIESLCEILMSEENGAMPEYEIKAYLAKWFEAQMENILQDDIDRLEEVARKLPYWDDAAFAAHITRNAKEARKDRDLHEQAQTYKKHREAEQRVQDAINDRFRKYNFDKSKITDEDIEELRGIAGAEGLQALNSFLYQLRGIDSNYGALQFSADATAYHKHWQEAISGRLSETELRNLALSGNLSPEQHRELHTAVTMARGDRERGIPGIKHDFEVGWKGLSEILGISKPAENETGEQASRRAQVVSLIQYDFATQLAMLFEQNPNMSFIQRNYERQQLIAKTVLKYKDILEEAYTNPNLIKDSSPKAMKNHYLEQAKGELRSFNTKDPAVSQVISAMEAAARQGKSYTLSNGDAKKLVPNGDKNQIKSIKAQFGRAAEAMLKYYSIGG